MWQEEHLCVSVEVQYSCPVTEFTAQNQSLICQRISSFNKSYFLQVEFGETVSHT